MSAEQPTIIYTLTDETPLLATYAFLPVLRAFTEAAGIKVKGHDGKFRAESLDMVPRAGPFSANFPLVSTSWYHRGKSSCCAVSTAI